MNECMNSNPLEQLLTKITGPEDTVFAVPEADVQVLR